MRGQKEPGVGGEKDITLGQRSGTFATLGDAEVCTVQECRVVVPIMSRTSCNVRNTNRNELPLSIEPCLKT